MTITPATSTIAGKSSAAFVSGDCGLVYSDNTNYFLVPVGGNVSHLTVAGPAPWFDVTSALSGCNPVVGDGATNDSPALQCFANKVPASGGELYVPAGLTPLLAATVAFPSPTRIVCGGIVESGQATSQNSVIFEANTAILMFQSGVMNSASVQQYGSRFENCAFRDTSASHNTVLGAFGVYNSNRNGCERCAFIDMTRGAIAAPAAPSISAGSGSTSYWVEITCVTDAMGETTNGAEAAATSGGATLTVTAPTSTGCPAPSSGYRVWATTASSAHEVLQPSTGNCTLNASLTGCALTSNWSGTVSNSGQGLAAVKYDTSAAFGVLTHSQGGADDHLADASYDYWTLNFCRNVEYCDLFQGGLQNIYGGEYDGNLADMYVGNYEGHIIANGVAYENGLGSPPLDRMLILNGISGSQIVSDKFEGGVAPPNNMTCVEVNSSRNTFYGNSWTKCNVVIQENSGFNSNTYELTGQSTNGSIFGSPPDPSDVIVGNADLLPFFGPIIM